MAELLVSSDPTSVSPGVYRSLLIDYLITCETEKLLDLLYRSCAFDACAELAVSALDLIYYDTPLAFTVINYPKLLLRIFNEAAVAAMQQMYSHPNFAKEANASVKTQVTVRIQNLPTIPSLTKPSIGHLRSHETEQLLQITGTITRTGNIRMLKISKDYQCAKCHYRFRVCSDPEQNYMLPQPSRCPAKAVGSDKPACVGTTIREVPNSEECIDYQEIKIQDRMERMDIGYLPKSLHVILERDLVDKFAAGDDVVIVGNLLRQWKYFQPGARCHVDIALHANSIRLLKSAVDRGMVGNNMKDEYTRYWQSYHDNPFAGRDNIIRAICPKIHGMYYVKLCLLLTLIGGSQRHETLSRRHHSHLLMIGDPGTGKSCFLKFAASLLPRSIITTGVGTTGAGLTCSAVREGADWALEAGALVLANNGVCCIDEFRSIKENDRVAIHEAMEQQTVSVAKAGIVVKLNTKCTVIAASNPKGNYDINADITTNTGIAAPLLSRFDLILILLDIPNKEWDKNISTYLLKQALTNGMDAEASEWSLQNLRRYVMYVREKLHPVMNNEAKCLLMRYYQMQRQQSDRSAARTTVRLLESLLRLAEAHAKLMFKAIGTFEDAVVAISCMEISAGQESVLGQCTALTTDIPDEPEKAYVALETRIFQQLQYSRVALKLDAEKLQSTDTSTVAQSCSPTPYKVQNDFEDVAYNRTDDHKVQNDFEDVANNRTDDYDLHSSPILPSKKPRAAADILDFGASNITLSREFSDQLPSLCISKSASETTAESKKQINAENANTSNSFNTTAGSSQAVWSQVVNVSEEVLSLIEEEDW